MRPLDSPVVHSIQSPIYSPFFSSIAVSISTLQFKAHSSNSSTHLHSIATSCLLLVLFIHLIHSIRPPATRKVWPFERLFNSFYSSFSFSVLQFQLTLREVRSEKPLCFLPWGAFTISTLQFVTLLENEEEEKHFYDNLKLHHDLTGHDYLL